MNRFSLHKFTSKDDIIFSPDEYSKFKFGSNEISKKFGYELAEGFINSNHFEEIVKKLQNNENQRLVILSSPYTYVKSATYSMVVFFIEYINHCLVFDCNLKPTIECKIFRSTFYKTDYGTLSKEERCKLISEDNFSSNYDLIKNNICLFLDDVYITGSHENQIVKMLNREKLIKDTNYFLYYAELINSNENPNIENYLNYAHIKTLNDLNTLICQNSFVFNTRIIKFILISNYEMFDSFINSQTDKFKEELYNLSIGESYYSIFEYRRNLDKLKTILLKN